MDQELKSSITKTGTTTLAIVCKDGIVVAADRRVSYGSNGGGVSYIAGSMQKIHPLMPNIIVTIAGTASDATKLIKLVRSELKLKELKSHSRPTLKQAANLFAAICYQSIRQPSVIPAIAHFLLAGYEDGKFELYDISADGLLKKIDTYQSVGSGMMQAHPILDSDYKKGMSVEEGINLAKKAINAAMNRDPASGEGMDIFVVRKDGIEEVSKQSVERTFKND